MKMALCVVMLSKSQSFRLQELSPQILTVTNNLSQEK